MENTTPKNKNTFTLAVAAEIRSGRLNVVWHRNRCLIIREVILYKVYVFSRARCQFVLLRVPSSGALKWRSEFTCTDEPTGLEGQLSFEIFKFKKLYTALNYRWMWLRVGKFTSKHRAVKIKGLKNRAYPASTTRSSYLALWVEPPETATIMTEPNLLPNAPSTWCILGTVVLSSSLET